MPANSRYPNESAAAFRRRMRAKRPVPSTLDQLRRIVGQHGGATAPPRRRKRRPSFKNPGRPL